MSDWLFNEVRRILSFQNVEGTTAEDISLRYYQLAKRIASHKYPNYSNIGNHGIACLGDALNNSHSVEELEVLAKLYASDSICGLLADPFAEDLSNNTQMVEGIIKAMVRHSDSEKLRIFVQILDRFCRDWYVGKTEEDTLKVYAAIRSVCLACPKIADEMSVILDLVKFRTVPKQRPKPPEFPKLTLHQRIFGI